MHLSSRNLPFELLNHGDQIVSEEPVLVPEPNINLETPLKLAIKNERQLQVPIDDPLTQDRIKKLMAMENLADITLPGYAIKLIRLHGPISYKALSEEVSKCFDALRRSDGSRYHGDLTKALKGCLSSSEVFIESEGNIWTIDESHAQMYEERTTKKIKSILSKKIKKESKKGGKDNYSNHNQDSESEVYESNNKNGNEKSFMRAKELGGTYSLKRPLSIFDDAFEVLSASCKAYKMEEKAEYLLQNPLKDIKTNDTSQQIIQKLGKERYIGIMQCFDYFSPIIEDYMNLKAQYMEKNSLSTKNGNQNEEDAEKSPKNAVEENNEGKSSDY